MGLTFEQIKARVKEIPTLDNETAHIREDELYIDFIKWVAESSTDPLARVHAQEVLKANDLDYGRWYA